MFVRLLRQDLTMGELQVQGKTYLKKVIGNSRKTLTSISASNRYMNAHTGAYMHYTPHMNKIR